MRRRTRSFYFILNVLSLFLCLGNTNDLRSQFAYKSAKSEGLKLIEKNLVLRKATANLFKSATDLTKYLPNKYVTTGTVDYTAALQNGIEKNRNIILPDFPILINFKGLKLRSNSSILFQENSKLILSPNDKDFYGLLNVEDVHDVNIYFPKLEGDRFTHLGKTGEWGMGIYIIHSININVENPDISKMWGDGIYIGKGAGITSSKIRVSYGIIDNNRRNSISVISGNQVLINDCLISNTHGTSPEYGIDIEPNKPEDYLNNIILSNNTTFNNKTGGLLFALDNLQGGRISEVKIQVNNHSDYYSGKGIEFHIDRGYQKFVNPLEGTITINGANLHQNDITMISNSSRPSKIDLNLINIKNNNLQINYSELSNFLIKFKHGKLKIVD